MKIPSTLKTCLLLAALPLAGWAQDTSVPTPTVSSAADRYGPREGNYELTLGGNAGSNKRFDDSFGGVNASLGYYFNQSLEGVVRQSVNYSNPSDAGTSWNGSTRLALDQHLAPWGPVRPFFGVNFGRVYGDGVPHTWAAGLEVGGKFYVKPQTFIYTTVEYAWFFRHGHDIDNRFSSGQYLGTVGIGFNF